MPVLSPKLPVRPMDPEYVSGLMTKKNVQLKFKNGFVKALRNYNKKLDSANKIYEKSYQNALKKLKEELDKI